jgi:hypothetical protein
MALTRHGGPPRHAAAPISILRLNHRICKLKLPGGKDVLQTHLRLRKMLRFFPDAAVKKWPRRGSSAASR